MSQSLPLLLPDVILIIGYFELIMYGLSYVVYYKILKIDNVLVVAPINSFFFLGLYLLWELRFFYQ
jgi:hypothetical protein